MKVVAMNEFLWILIVVVVAIAIAVFFVVRRARRAGKVLAARASDRSER